MNKAQHERANVVIAIVTLTLGWLLTYIDYFYNEEPGVHQSVLWVLGQSLTFSGALLGIKSYVDYRTAHNNNQNENYQ